MSDPLKQALKEAYATAPTDEILLETLEFIHPNFKNNAGSNTSIRVVNDYSDFTAQLETSAPLNAGQRVRFTRFSFELTLPTVKEGSNKELKLTIDNISNEITKNLDLTKGSTDKIKLIYRPYLSTDTTGPQLDPPYEFIITKALVNNFKIEATAAFSFDLTNISFPREIYTVKRFPSLVS